jgi:hypothetical protein
VEEPAHEEEREGRDRALLVKDPKFQDPRSKVCFLGALIYTCITLSLYGYLGRGGGEVSVFSWDFGSGNNCYCSLSSSLLECLSRARAVMG